MTRSRAERSPSIGDVPRPLARGLLPGASWSLDAFCAGVRRAALALGSGLLRHPSNEGLRDELASERLSCRAFGHQVLTTLYRLLFLLVAEDRDGLHTKRADSQQRRSFEDQYSMARLRRLASSSPGDAESDLWSNFLLLSGWLAQESGCPELGLPPLSGALFRTCETAALSGCALANSDWLEVVRCVAIAGPEGPAVDFSTLPTEHLGSAYAWMLELRPEVDLASRSFGLQSAAGHARRTTGSYYTPEPLIETVLALALDPLLDRACASAEPAAAILALSVCDPACGSGHFLLAAARKLSKRLLACGACCELDALREVLGRCLYGVDLNPIAIELCKAVLWLEARDPDLPMTFLDPRLLCGNSLVGATPAMMAGPGQQESGSKEGRHSADRWCATFLARQDPLLQATDEQVSRLSSHYRFLHWHLAFPDVFQARPGAVEGGFDAVIGNPPWIAHAGRAAQPLDPPVRAWHDAFNPAFAGYKSTHGMFVYLAATLLRPAGRLGLVLPTSVSDLDGYAPVRRAHDRLCVVLPSLPDFGDVFKGVFQPCMALVSVRRDRTCSDPCTGAPWELAREELSSDERAMLATLSALPSLPASLFGERGLQTTARMREAIVRADGPVEPCTTALREGTDVREFETRTPRLYADPARVAASLRPAKDWHQVAIFVRQTARWPIATASDGLAFRNSILAGFEREGWDRAFLLCLLNSSLIRWYHYTRFRDARQGMPQVKIGHLRAIPAPIRMSRDVQIALQELGARLIERNSGVRDDERVGMDELVFGCYALSAGQRAIVTAWWANAPGRSSRVTPSADGS